MDQPELDGADWFKLTGVDLVTASDKDVNSHKPASVTYLHVKVFWEPVLGTINKTQRGERRTLSYASVRQLRLCVWHFSIHNRIKCSQLWSGTLGSSSVFFCWKSAKAFVVGVGSVRAWMNGLDMRVRPTREGVRESWGGTRSSCVLSPYELFATLLMSVLIPRTWPRHKRKGPGHCLTTVRVRGMRKKMNCERNKDVRSHSPEVQVTESYSTWWLTDCIMKVLLSGEITSGGRPNQATILRRHNMECNYHIGACCRQRGELPRVWEK